MKITRRDLKVILLLIGVLSAFLVYQFNFKGKLDDIAAEEKKQTNLEKEIEELEKKVAYKGKWTNDMASYQEDIKAELEKYPAFAKYEDLLLYLYNLEHTYDIYFDSYTLNESSLIQSVSGNIDKTQYDISLLGASTKATFNTTYIDLKKFINNLYHTDVKVRAITSLNIKLDENLGKLSGSIEFLDMALTDGNRQYEDIKVPEFEEIYEPGFVPSTDPDTGNYNGIIGVDNIFEKPEETTEESSEMSTAR